MTRRTARGLRAVINFLASGAVALRPEACLPSMAECRWSTYDDRTGHEWTVADEAAAWLYANS